MPGVVPEANAGQQETKNQWEELTMKRRQGKSTLYKGGQKKHTPPGGPFKKEEPKKTEGIPKR